jgi:hypothetical protein
MERIQENSGWFPNGPNPLKSGQKLLIKAAQIGRQDRSYSQKEA